MLGLHVPWNLACALLLDWFYIHINMRNGIRDHKRNSMLFALLLVCLLNEIIFCDKWKWHPNTTDIHSFDFYGRTPICAPVTNDLDSFSRISVDWLRSHCPYSSSSNSTFAHHDLTSFVCAHFMIRIYWWDTCLVEEYEQQQQQRFIQKDKMLRKNTQWTQWYLGEKLRSIMQCWTVQVIPLLSSSSKEWMSVLGDDVKMSHVAFLCVLSKLCLCHNCTLYRPDNKYPQTKLIEFAFCQQLSQLVGAKAVYRTSILEWKRQKRSNEHM